MPTATTLSARVRSRDYRGHHRGTVQPATWAENLQSMQSYLQILKDRFSECDPANAELREARTNQIERQERAIAEHMARRPETSPEDFCDFCESSDCRCSCTIEPTYRGRSFVLTLAA